MTSGSAVADSQSTQPLSTRIVSRGRVFFGSLYWLFWIIGSPRSVVTTGVARELDTLSVGALPLVGLASIMVGLITTFQVAYQLSNYGAEAISGQAVGWFAWRELGPVVVAILVVSRSASAITGELAAMSANAEIDALRAMGLDPIKYLVSPKLAALLLGIPALTVVADGLIALGGWIGSTFFLRFNTLLYLEELRTAVAMRDFFIGIGKSVIFAVIIANVASDEGLNVEPRVGAIGQAAARSVVFCLLGVLAADTFVNAVFYFIPTLVY
jgi:phospholipid/cholesterol/gamma-HCH transport system permease protein